MVNSQQNSTNDIASGIFSAFMLMKSKMNLKTEFAQMPIAQIETLRLIAEKKQVLMKEVATFLSITPPSATVLIDNLTKSGWVSRHSGSSDRRSITLSLTKKGLEVLERGVKERCKDLKKLIGNLSIKEQNELLSILKKMVSQNN